MTNAAGGFPTRGHIVAALLMAILIGGGVLRLVNLAGPNFGADEILHVYPAQRLMVGDPPLLPSDLPYPRALIFTRTMAGAGLLFGGLNEWTARFPSVVFGCLTILVVFLIGSRWYSDTAGLVAAAVTAVAPMQVSFSRQARMYAFFQLLYLVVIYLIFEGFESFSSKPTRWVPRRIEAWCAAIEVRPTLLLIALPLVLLAWETQRLIAPALTGPITYVVCMALIAPFMNQVPRAVVRKYSGTAVLLIIGGLACVAMNIGSIRQMYEAARSFAPSWAESNVGHWRFYAYTFAEFYPTIFGTFLLAGAVALTQNWRATVYLLACFAAPFLLHSFVFAWKELRYLFHIMPLMFVIFGVGMSASISVLYGTLTAWTSRAVKKRPRLVGGALTAAAVIFLFGATPELREGVKLHNLNVGQFAGVQHFSWNRAMSLIAERAQPSDVVVTSRTLLSRYYGPELLHLYLLNHDEMNFVLAEDLRDEDGRLIESSIRAPVIVDLQMLKEVLRQHPSGWFVTESVHFGSHSIPGDIVQFIERQFQREVVPGADDMTVFHWGERSAAETGSIATQ